MAGFIDVLLRGLALTGQAVAIGGVVFALVVLRARQDDSGAVRVWTLVAAGAAIVVLAQAGMLALLAGALDAPPGTLTARLVATQYFRATGARALAALVLVIAALTVRRAPRVGTWWPLLLGGATVMMISAAWTSHAAARLDHRAILLALDALHQVAASAWIGGLLD